MRKNYIKKEYEKMEVSIVIPTMNLELTKKCVDSIIKYTHLENKEIIIVANGADEKIKEYINELFNNGIPIRCKWFDKPLGAVIALNEGIKESTGEFILLLNDDCEILESYLDYWVSSLLMPFSDPTMGCTGPYKMNIMTLGENRLNFSIDDIKYGFIVFFCALIRRSLFDKIGLLDENLKCGVDVDFCLRLKRHGYKIQQVPENEKMDYSDPKHPSGSYPIWHQAEATVYSFYGPEEWGEIIKNDVKKLENKYMCKKVSIVIPTITRSLVVKCIQSIIDNTNMEDIELIIVANGADLELGDDLIKFEEKYHINLSVLWYPKPLGAVRAFNEGIKRATGEYVLLLNDDCEILQFKTKGLWLTELLKEFSDQSVGCVGPFKLSCEFDDDIIPKEIRQFIIFFCAIIPNNLFKKLGYLDESFISAADMDFCFRLQLEGYKIIQCPEENLLDRSNNNSKWFKGYFPIFHPGASTVHNYYGGKENWSKFLDLDKETIVKKYEKILKKDLRVVDEKKLPDGYFSDDDIKLYRELINSLPNNGTFAEVGSLIGKSLCSVADIIIKKNLKVISVDLFDDFYVPMFDAHFPNQYQTFIDNMKTFKIYDRVEIKKGKSSEISKEIENNSLDLVFIDVDHEYLSVKEDFTKWYPKVKTEGIVAGHDSSWESVRQALDHTWGTEGIYNGFNNIFSTNMWFIKKPRIFDCFMFFNELDVLEIRLNELYDVVTKFIIVEGTRKHSGEQNDKMYLLNNMDRFKKFKDKIIHIVVDDFPPNPNNDAWVFERYLRDCVMRGWFNYNLQIHDEDVIIISDADEIPSLESISSYKVKEGICYLDQKLYYDYLNNYCQQWGWVKVLPFGIAKNLTPCGIRYVHTYNRIENGGWHFSYMGGIDQIKEKITSYAHQEYNKPEFINDIEKSVKNGEDIFKRKGIIKTVVDIDDSFPKFVKNNIIDFERKGFIKMDKDLNEKIESLEIKDEMNIITDFQHGTWQKKYELVMLQECLKNERLSKIMEIGVAYGGTATVWAKIVQKYDGKVYCVDQHFHENSLYKGTEWEKYITEYLGDSHNLEFVKKLKNEIGEVDFLFIDGDHSYDGVKKDFQLFYQFVKVGGFIGFHDILDTQHHREQGCYVCNFWNEIKDLYPNWQFIDSNEYNGCPSKSMGIGLIQKISEDIKLPIDFELKKSESKGSDVLCSICTKNRYDSTLSLAISSVINQTVKPDKLIIYDDNTDEDRRDLRENETYAYLFDMLGMNNIKWEIIFGAKLGQHYGHQFMNKNKYKFVWRLDDDEVASPNVLEKLLFYMNDDVGAVGGVILTKGCGGEASGKLEDIYSKANVQWNLENQIIEVDHLHSSFLYRSNIVDYCLDLSPVAHREETLFTHELKQKGYKLIVDQSIITYHLKQKSTGIRSHNSEWFYKHDEKIFTEKMESWGYKVINLDCGLGDHLAFLNILPKLKEKWKHLIIGVCFPEVFEDYPDITIASISQLSNVINDNIYKWMIDNKWNDNIIKAYERYYEV